MIVVIPNGNVTKPGITAGGYNDTAMALFKEELAGSIIPFIEKNYRAKPNAANRAMSGLSMGGAQRFIQACVIPTCLRMWVFSALVCLEESTGRPPLLILTPLYPGC